VSAARGKGFAKACNAADETPIETFGKTEQGGKKNSTKKKKNQRKQKKKKIGGLAARQHMRAATGKQGQQTARAVQAAGIGKLQIPVRVPVKAGGHEQMGRPKPQRVTLALTVP
jgi:hypothetical protein